MATPDADLVIDLATAPTLGRPEITLEVTRGAARLLIGLGFAPLAEVVLPNGRRADLMALGRRGEVAIVEVKSSLEDYRVDRKWREYAPYCERFYFAVSPDFPRDVLADGPGLIVADSFGGAILTESPSMPMAPARRKALTLAFARLAAMRALAV
jgi:hypothetical protein